nr:hypothetical protein [Nannocystis pusilla]
MEAVGALEGGGEAEAERGQAALGDEAVGRRGQVMALVAHEEAVAVAVELGLGGGRVVGGDGDLARLAVAAAEHADRPLQPVAQHLLPLQHEIDGGHDDQRGPAGVDDGEDGEDRLARARGQLDHPDAAGGPPRGQRVTLVRERLERARQREIEAIVDASFVDVRNVGVVKMRDDRAVPVRRCAVRAGAAVEAHERSQPRVAVGDAEDDERAVIEVELDGHVAARRVAAIAAMRACARPARQACIFGTMPEWRDSTAGATGGWTRRGDEARRSSRGDEDREAAPRAERQPGGGDEDLDSGGPDPQAPAISAGDSDAGLSTIREAPRAGGSTTQGARPASRPRWRGPARGRGGRWRRARRR